MTPWTTAFQASLFFTMSLNLRKYVSFESVVLSNHCILCRLFLLLPFIFKSIRVFSNEMAVSIRWPRYQSFSFSISLSKEYLGLISFRINWLGAPCSPKDSQESSPAPQYKSINSSALSLLYGPTLTFVHDYWKNHSLDYMDLCWQSDIFIL